MSRVVCEKGLFLVLTFLTKYILKQKQEPAGRVPPLRHSLCPNGNKKNTKNASLLAEGNSFLEVSAVFINETTQLPALP